MGDTVEALAYKTDVPARAKDAASEKLETVRGTVGNVADGVKDAAGGAKDAAGGAAGALKETVSGALGAAKGAVGGAAGAVKGAVGGVAQSAAGLGSQLPDPGRVGDVARRGAGFVTQNPLGLVLGGLAVGFLAGLLVPVTEYERRTVGPIRDDLVEKAQTVGSDALAHGREVLQQTTQATIETAQRSLQEHGHQALNEGFGERGIAGTVIEHGRAILEETARTAADTARQAAIEHGKQIVSEAKGETVHGQSADQQAGRSPQQSGGTEAGPVSG
ncbi:MAG TPA: hypothetical protein VFB22_13075 [Candidatus Baltobacteraceae bacterium]|nr:hypothetical protein [Candidatus Baltobacteraceae bacterium]